MYHLHRLPDQCENTATYLCEDGGLPHWGSQRASRADVSSQKPLESEL